MIESIFQQILLALPLVMGAYLSISLMKLPDLSLESAYLCGAILGALAPGPLPFFLAFIGGALVGFITGVLNQLCRLPFLLAALVVNGLFHGVNLFLLKGALLSFKADSGAALFSFVAVVLGSFLFVILRSQLGYALAIQGNNPLFFKHHNISTPYVVIAGTILSNGCAGLSGYLFAASNGFVDLTLSFGIILLCITSLMLGKIFIQQEHPTLLIPLTGITAYFILQHALMQLGFPLKYFNAFQAVMVLSIWIFSRPAKNRITMDHLGI
jgi:putative ABC transport system permease protein